MKKTYLKEFVKYTQNKIAYIPVGTIEWHGNHLPIETDFLVAKKICEIVAKNNSGYILPPIYMGSDRKEKIGGKQLVGMDRYVGKKLQGSVYYLEPNFFSELIINLSNNLISQGFEKIILVTGHAGTGQIKALEMAKKKIKNLSVCNPYETLEKNGIHVEHADENETSLFWACYPEEEIKIRKIKLKRDDDYVKFLGYNPISKASLALGKRMLNEIIKKIK